MITPLVVVTLLGWLRAVGAERVVVHASRRANVLPGGALGRLELFSELANQDELVGHVVTRVR